MSRIVVYPRYPPPCLAVSYGSGVAPKSLAGTSILWSGRGVETLLVGLRCSTVRDLRRGCTGLPPLLCPGYSGLAGVVRMGGSSYAAVMYKK